MSPERADGVAHVPRQGVERLEGQGRPHLFLGALDTSELDLGRAEGLVRRKTVTDLLVGGTLKVVVEGPFDLVTAEESPQEGP